MKRSGVPAQFVGAPLRASTNLWWAELIPFGNPTGSSEGKKPDAIANVKARKAIRQRVGRDLSKTAGAEGLQGPNA